MARKKKLSRKEAQQAAKRKVEKNASNASKKKAGKNVFGNQAYNGKY